MNSLQATIFGVLLICLLQQGLVALNCKQCSIRDASCSPTRTIECTSNEVCIVVEVRIGGNIRFFKDCRDEADCNDTKAACNLRWAPECLGYGCCKTDLCDPVLTPVGGTNASSPKTATYSPTTATTADSSGIRCVISPLIVIFVAIGLMQWVF